jgi:hypothetical protein
MGAGGRQIAPLLKRALSIEPAMSFNTLPLAKTPEPAA